MLDELLDASEDGRKTLLAALKATDPELAQTAERLLASALDESSLAQGLGAVAPNLLTELARESDPEEPTLRIGDRVGVYRIVELIGSGGMGSVYRAERDDGTYEQTVAVKFVRRSISGERTGTLLEKERSQLARLEHPNIARIIDGGVSDTGELYYVMEYIDGVAIDRGVAGKDREEILAAMLQLCDAVGYCHRSLVVHGDIKPQNILLSDGRVRLLDFGIARLLTEGDRAPKPVYAFSPQYASPEQVDGEQPSIPSDIFSLGIVLAQLLTGQPEGVGCENARQNLSRCESAARPRGHRQALRGRGPRRSLRNRSSARRRFASFPGALPGECANPHQNLPDKKVHSA